MKKYLISLLLVSPFFVFAQTFDRDLFFGIQKDSDVTKLQEFLTEQGVYSGPISGNFFSLTLQGVKTFQIKQGISPTSGYFGPKSRVKANLILAAQGVSSTGVADESGSPTPAAITPPKTTNDTVSALMVQIQLLQQQLNALQKQQNTNPVPTPPPIVTLPSPNQVSPTILQISSVAVSTGLPSARIEWKTNIPSDSKLFLTDPDGTPHIYSSLSGFSTQHFVNMTLAAGLTFSYEIEAIAQGSVAKYVGKFTMGNHMPTKLWWDSTSNPQFWGLYCSRTHILAKIIDENGDEMNGQPVEITNTYTNEVKNGLSPFFADFGINTMKQASFQLVIKSGSLQQALNVNINEPHFKLWTTDGRRVDANYDPGPFSPDRNNGTYIDQDGGLSLMKTDTGFVCAH